MLDENIGTTFGGRCEILSVIASGGAGSVYLGRQKLMKRTVAIKFMLESGASGELGRKRSGESEKKKGWKRFLPW
ncbi:MAG TPA: hypothetical protein VKK81_26655 [Candidatus Binatia bacterium]|nr:hypothetical protein [Candidatus Binatia bacterium]